jgi:hypothetical protein
MSSVLVQSEWFGATKKRITEAIADCRSNKSSATLRLEYATKAEKETLQKYIIKMGGSLDNIELVMQVEPKPYKPHGLTSAQNHLTYEERVEYIKSIEEERGVVLVTFVKFE